MCVLVFRRFICIFSSKHSHDCGGMEWLEDRVEGLRERSDSGGDKAKGEGW